MRSILVSCAAALLSLTVAADPLVEKALVFDGVNDFVEIPHDSSLSLQSLTVEAWVRIEGGYDFLLNPAVTKGADYGNYSLMVLGSQTLASPGSPGYAHRIATGNVSVGGSRTSLAIGGWTHLAATYSDGLLEFYVNGVLEGLFSGPPAFLSPLESPTDVFLGRAVFFSRADEFLRGALDEVRIWNVPRTATEIRDNMNCVVNPYTPGLVGNWRFNEAYEAQTVADSSPFGNHGTRGTAATAAYDDPARTLSTALSFVGCPIDPRSAGFWKHQCGDLGFQRIGRLELEGLFGIVAADSDAIPECAPVGCEVFDLQASPEMRTKAEGQFLALRLNVASGRLQGGTPVELPGLTGATTVAEAIAEIEGALCDPRAGRPDLEAAKDIAEAINSEGEDMDLVGQRPAPIVEPGELVAVEFGLINMSPRRTRYLLTTEAPWPHDVPVGQRVDLDSGELAVITVMVDVPTSVTPGETTPIRVTATDMFGEAGRARDAVVTLRVAQPAAAPGFVGSVAGEDRVVDIQESE